MSDVAEELVQYTQRLEARVRLLEEEKQALQQKLKQSPPTPVIPWEQPPSSTTNTDTVIMILDKLGSKQAEPISLCLVWMIEVRLVQLQNSSIHHVDEVLQE